MNHSKIILVGCISAFVAITTAVLGVAGTIIGSVLSSVLYNVLSEVLEKPVAEKQFNLNLEYDIAYVFPLVVIAIIQLLLILAFLAQWGYLPITFLNAYLMIQGVVDNNLYRILGIALFVMSIYPFIIKPDTIKKRQGLLIAFIGLIFVARGFADVHNSVSAIYDNLFIYFDFPIEVFAFLLLVYVIISILHNASENKQNNKRNNLRRVSPNINEHPTFSRKINNEHSGHEENYNHRTINHNPKYIPHNTRNINPNPKRKSNPMINPYYTENNSQNDDLDKNYDSTINESSEDIKFESNSLLNKYKGKK